MTDKPIRKILVVALDNLGDVVMGTSVFRILRRAFPGAKLGYWVKSYAAGLFEDHTLVDLVHSSNPFWDDAPGHPRGTWKEFRSSMAEIRKEKYDAAVLLNTEWRRCLAAWWIGIPIRIGLRQRKSQYFLTQSFPPIPDRHRVDEHNSIVERWTGLQLPADLSFPRLEVNEDGLRWVRHWLEKHQWQDKPLVVCHPFAGRSDRCWPVPSFLQLIRDSVRIHPQLRFVFVCDQFEGVRLVESLHLVPRGSTLIFSGAALSHVKALLSQAAVFIGGDSGPGHLAAALAKPVISLFGPSNPDHFAPRGHGPVKVIKRSPIGELPVADVANAISEIIKVPV